MGSNPGVGVPKPASDVVVRTIAGETLLVPVERGIANCDRVFVLNETGAFLWQRLDGHRGREALIRELASEFDVPPAGDVAGDVDAFLRALEARDLITWELA